MAGMGTYGRPAPPMLGSNATRSIPGKQGTGLDVAKKAKAAGQKKAMLGGLR